MDRATPQAPLQSRAGNGKTLIILTPGFPANEADTACLPFLQTHIGALNKTFPDLEIIVLAFQYPYFNGTYTWQGNEVISFDGREKGKLNRLVIWMKVWQELKRLKKRKNVAGLFSLWYTECAMMGHYFGKRHHVKHYTWLCGQDAKKGNRYVRLAPPKANELIAMSDFLKREFDKNYGVMPAHVIPIGVDPEQFSAPAPDRDIHVLGAGSLIPLKQYDVFIRVIQKLASTQPINAKICGKGAEEDKLRSMISTLNLQRKVTLAGEIPHPEVLQLMQRAKIFLHTSNYEGFGTVCLEALYAGAHVVSFTKPMDRDIPHWHHVSSEEEMAGKVCELLQSRATKYESECAYSAAEVAGAMMKLFDD